MNSQLEARVRRTGRELFKLIEGETPSLFDKAYWTGRLMEWATSEEAFKVELFRFIDVLPYLTRRVSIAEHVIEYFCRSNRDYPLVLQLGLKGACATSLVAKMAAGTIAENIERMGRQFIAAETPPKALPILEGLRSEGLAFSADLLGEAVVSEKEAEGFLQRYLEFFDLLDKAQQKWQPLGPPHNELDWGFAPKVNVSVKPSAMYSQMNPAAFDHSVSQAKERLRPIFRKAMATGAHVILDMENYDLKNLTYALYKALMEEPEFKGYPYTGTVVQAYLRESEDDLRDLIQWAKRQRQRFTIRLVKGAYWDAETVWAAQRNWPAPVFGSKSRTDANFEKLVGQIMENHEWVDLACASQNIRSIAYVTELAKDLKLPPGNLEYQILYGMAEPVRNALRKAGFPLRLYTPIGELIPGMAYLVRRLLENTSNESFIRQRFLDGVSREALLKNPLEHLQEEPSGEDKVAGHGLPPFQNEPHYDWAISENRDLFGRELKEVRKKFPFKVPLHLGGKKIRMKNKILSTNPNAPEEVIGQISSAGKKEAEKAVSAARSAFPRWRDTDSGERAEYLFRAAAAARSMRREMAAIQVYEVGKTWSEADADVCEAIDFLEYYGREMIRLSIPRLMGSVPGENSRLFYEPRGVAAVIAPWNFPLAISMGMTSAALVTGNTVIYKPSSLSCVTGSMIDRLFSMIDLPPGVLNFLPGPGGEIGEALVTHPEVSIIAFTGSKEVGLGIIEKARHTPEGAGQIKQVVAEMGGKNAIILDADADLDEAILHVLQSSFGYQGQKCSACSRLIVLEENYDRVLERLKSAAESIELGPTEDPGSFMGAVIDGEAWAKIRRYIEIGKQEGTLFLERSVPGAGGHFAPLTIFTDIHADHRLAREEIFGPVLAVIKVKDFEEALAVANSTQYALTGALFSRSPAHIAEAKKRFRVGNLYINRGCTGSIVGRHPFGGFRMSGVGSKSGGPDYLLQFMIPRNVVENTLRRGFAPTDEES